MNKIIFLMLLAVCAATATAQTRGGERRRVTPQAISTKSNEQILPIRRVILYSNGVAYIERRGIVPARAEINLSFKQSQVDDVLKSMLVLDLGGGRIGAVSYNSSAPPSARMAEIPFSVESATDGASGGLAGVLAQLQGAKVSVVSTKDAGAGSILTVEKRDIKTDDGKTSVAARFLVIAGENGELSSFDLADVRSIKLLDAGAQKDLTEFASATASARRRDAKTITVTSDGQNAREMMVSYTIAAPIWKTTYRVVLDDAGKPFFQGWAIVDNVSDEDWRDVSLSLVSGSPVSFIQSLQRPLFRHRPIVEIPDDLSLEPQVYDPTVGHGEGSGGGQGSGVGNGVGYGSGNGVGAAPPAPELAMKTELSDVLKSGNSGVETAASGAKHGDLFEYQIKQTVTVERDRSALIPIVQTAMEGERVSIYRQASDETSAAKNRPMSGLLLKNTTALTFENGALTVLEGNAYAGEALMERLKPNENRLISFALDLETLVSVKQDERREPAKLVKAVDGNFQVHYFKTSRKIYTLQNQSDRAHVVYVEHPTREKWSLSEDTIKPTETTENYYRFRVELKPFETFVLPIAEKQALMDSYVLTRLTPGNLELLVKQNSINVATSQKLEKLIDLRARANEITEKIDALNAEEKQIATDQARFRENIEALSKTPEAKTLIARYIAKAGEQETRIEQIGKERQTLQAERVRLENELAAQIRAFEI